MIFQTALHSQADSPPTSAGSAKSVTHIQFSPHPSTLTKSGDRSFGGGNSVYTCIVCVLHTYLQKATFSFFPQLCVCYHAYREKICIANEVALVCRVEFVFSSSVRAGIGINRLCYKADFYTKPLRLQRSRFMTTQICHCSAWSPLEGPNPA